ncbi:type IV pilin protein [Candidatus Omnitrophota bacterium]
MNKKAFTLIEVLIVVLILGVLATIALPQFKQVIWKSRYREVFNIVSGIAKAEQLYLMEYGEYTKFDNMQCMAGEGYATGSTQVQRALSVDIPDDSYFIYLIEPSTQHPNTTQIFFRTAAYDWAYSYNYVTNTWVKYFNDGGPAQQYFNPPD